MSWFDPVAHLEDPEWPKLNEAGFTESPHLWFDDGTVVIVCTGSPDLKMGFRINESVLCLNSSVFKDMFSAGQPQHLAREDSFEGCPIVRLPDDSFSMNNLLRMLYERSYGQNLNDFTLAEIEGVLHLASKYMVYHVRTVIVQHLETLFPTSLQDYRRNPSTPHEECFRGLKIAIQFDLPSLIPCAMYLCSLHEAQYIFAELHHLDLESEIKNVLSFKEELADRITNDVLTSEYFVFDGKCVKTPASVGCNGIDPTTARRILVAYMDSKIDVFANNPTDNLRGQTDPQCCFACVRDRQRLEEEKYKLMLWGHLPSLAYVDDSREWTTWAHVDQARRDAIQTWAMAPRSAQ
ncbi:unnamed protein product [Peniophora sp. CBMAI 1063]|nr:unnamed protein product [Peniophora sp. CBMAI 1063]